MNIHFKFSNLLGSFYTGGDLSFSDDGWRLFSPVGNQVSVYDLKHYKSLTLQVGARKSIERVALAPGNALMLAIDEDGTAYLYSLVAKSVLHRHRFNRHIFDVAFCQNSSGELLFSLTFDNLIHVYKILSLAAAGSSGTASENTPLVASVQYNPFELVRSYFGPTSETVCLDWSGDGRTFLVGSRDMSVRLFAAEKCPNLAVFVLGHHKDVIVACRFLSNTTLDCFSLSRDGQLCVWQCDTKLADLFKATDQDADEVAASPANDDDDAETKIDASRRRATYKGNKIIYRRIGRHFYRKNVVAESYVNINAVAYSKSNRLLACALSNGIFCIHEMPNFVQIQSLNIGDAQIITALKFNATAEWIAMASSQTGQLIVYDWRAQSYVVNQTGHFNQMTCSAYAPDGSMLATGSEDGKIKVWDPSSGFCTVTFAGEHTGAITALQFTQAGRAVLSASRDGTIRAYDLVRYRNFRTFTAPTLQQVQFSCLAVDASGDMVAAASSNGFEAYVWSVKTGRLLEELTGHEAPVSGIAFGQAAGRSLLLATSSWDKTCKLWDCFTTSKQQSHETLRLDGDGLAVAFRGDGAQLAVCTLRSTIYLFSSPPDPGATDAGITIDAKHDLGKLRRNKDLVTGAHAAHARSFTTLCYTTDGGTCLLVGGQTKYICMYHVAQRQLIKRFSITCNFSFDRMEEFLRRSQMTDFGSRAQMFVTNGPSTTSRIANIDSATGNADAENLRLPGVRGGQSLTSREHLQPEARCVWLSMSPTGQNFAACTQDGLQIYSLSSTEMDVFNPFDLDITIDPGSIYAIVDAAGDPATMPDYGRALLMALKLNKPPVTLYVIERIPHDRIAQVVRSVPHYALTRLIEFIAKQLETTQHVEFYLIWIRQVVFAHGLYIKQQQQQTSGAGTAAGRHVEGGFRAATNLLIKCLTEKKAQVGKMVDHALYTSRYVVEQSVLAEARAERKKTEQQSALSVTKAQA